LIRHSALLDNFARDLAGKGEVLEKSHSKRLGIALRGCGR